LGLDRFERCRKIQTRRKDQDVDEEAGIRKLKALLKPADVAEISC